MGSVGEQPWTCLHKSHPLTGGAIVPVSFVSQTIVKVLARTIMGVSRLPWCFVCKHLCLLQGSVGPSWYGVHPSSWGQHCRGTAEGSTGNCTAVCGCSAGEGSHRRGKV